MTGNSALSVEVKLLRDLDAVERDAGGALDRAAQPSLFRRLDWFRLLETHCPPPGDLLVIRAREGEASAWLFLKVEGARAAGLSNWYSFDFGAITHRAGDACDRLVAALAGGLDEAGIAVVDCAPLLEDDPLRRGLAGTRRLSRVTENTVRWSADTAGKDFAAYWAERPSRIRHTAERKGRTAGLDLVIHTAFSDAAWADYERVYGASWKPAEGSPGFLRALAEQESAAGALRLGLAYKDGAPVASHLWLTENGTATIHKLAYVASARTLSPGTVLGREMFRHALDEDRVSVIDFGLGDDRYKAEWVDRREAMHRLVAYDLRSAAGLWRAGKAAGRALVRRLRND